MRGIIIQGLSIAVVSSFFIGVGLRILLAKRPVIEGQWWQALTLFVSLTAMAGLLMTLSPGYLGQSWLLAFLVVGGLTMMWGTILWSLRRGNVIVIGITETELRDALRHALHRLSLPYQESAQSFSLPTLNNELMAEAIAFNGMFGVRLKRSGDRSAFRQLAAEIDDFFRTTPARINPRFGYALVLIGAVLLFFGSWLTYERLSLESKMRAAREAHYETVP